MNPWGAILAGGESRRYGSPKALAEVGGTRIIDRVVARLGSVTPELVLLANEPDLFADLALPTRPDDRPGTGVLAGLATALRWARDEGRPGVLAVACDMPFLSVPLLRRLRDDAFGTRMEAGTGTESGEAGAEAGTPAAADVDVVVPESGGRRGIEPLCAAYRTSALDAIQAALDRDDRRMIGFHSDVRVGRVPLAEVRELCDPEVAFMNVNTPGERERADRIAREESHGG